LLLLCLCLAHASAIAQGLEKDTRPPIAPDIREDEIDVKLQKRDFVAVPIPMSGPTLGSGLIIGAAYFYRQTEAQKAVQPASLTGIGAMYTDNDSKAFLIAQQNYWKSNKWRFTGAVGAADLRLSLLVPGLAGNDLNLDWRVQAEVLMARLSGQVRRGWYAGFLARYIDAKQTIELGLADPGSLQTIPDIRSVGLGTYLEYDTRDLPSNAYSGRYFKLDALFNDESIGSDKSYQNYSASFNSYHSIGDSLVLAWQLKGCSRHGSIPLWDTCMIKLRGFSATDYMGTESGSGQVEARWRMSERWGMVGFAGRGYAKELLNQGNAREWIPSYGVGIRFMVLKSKRINLRLDFARSTDSDAVHFAVGEAF